MRRRTVTHIADTLHDDLVQRLTAAIILLEGGHRAAALTELREICSELATLTQQLQHEAHTRSGQTDTESLLHVDGTQ